MNHEFIIQCRTGKPINMKNEFSFASAAMENIQCLHKYLLSKSIALFGAADEGE